MQVLSWRSGDTHLARNSSEHGELGVIFPSHKKKQLRTTVVSKRTDQRGQPMAFICVRARELTAMTRNAPCWRNTWVAGGL